MEMDVLTAIHSRRSIRAYTDEHVSEEDIHQLLNAAMIAPSAGNARPWRFIVVDEPELMQKMAAINPYAGMAVKAPLGIVVCGDTRLEKYQGFWVQDCSAALQNIMLAATGLGLGSVWTGIYPVEERVAAFRKLFHLPDGVIPLGLVVVGHPHKQKNEYTSRFEEEKVHRNKY